MNAVGLALRDRLVQDASPPLSHFFIVYLLTFSVDAGALDSDT